MMAKIEVLERELYTKRIILADFDLGMKKEIDPLKTQLDA
jgi:hypothetical protein